MNSTSNTKIVNALGAISVNGAATCNVIDCVGYDHCTIIVNFGLIGAADYTALKVTEANVASSATALTSPNDVTGTVVGTDADAFGTASVFPGGSDDGKVVIFEIDLKARKRYLLLAATSGAASLMSATAILSRGEQAPVTATQRGAFSVLKAA
jgi:hypothetical protein